MWQVLEFKKKKKFGAQKYGNSIVKFFLCPEFSFKPKSVLIFCLIIACLTKEIIEAYFVDRMSGRTVGSDQGHMH